MRILILDDDSDLKIKLDESNSASKLKIKHIKNDLLIVSSIEEFNPDVVIIDCDCESEKGRRIIEAVQSKDVSIPILIVTEIDSYKEIQAAFKLGVSDFLKKPINAVELVARLRKRVNKSLEKDNNQLLKHKDLEFDTSLKKVYKNKKDLKLSPKEYQLIIFLCKNKGKVFSRHDLIERVWKLEKYVVLKSVDVYINRLRKKLGGNKYEYIKTRKGFGYYLEFDSQN